MINTQSDFMLGVNYWPRKSGVRFYREFDPEELAKEFGEIRALGCDTVRVFVLWDDFQPIREFPGGHGTPRAIALRDDWNASPRENPALLDPAMLKKFDCVVETASRNNLRLIVALLTAWMSGTLFEPMFRNGRNYFSDPFMLKYQMLYCRYFTARYAGNPTIRYWEFGNEQNCVARCDTPEAAWVWMQSLALSIRQGDPSGKIASGMHGLQLHPSRKSPWGIRESAEAVDCLTTHPYPEFTPGCFQESPLALRSNLHATAQSVYYATLGRRPTLCEETGSLGASVISERESAEYLRMRLYSLWANGVAGCLWWCFSDFTCSGDLPYRDALMENDGLGLFRADGSPRPAAQEMKRFRETLKTLPRLPERRVDAAILVSDLVEDFPTALTAYALCKQAGLEPEFAALDSDVPLEKYKLLIAPSFGGHAPCTVPAYRKLAAAVAAGATLFWSGDGATLLESGRLFGIQEMVKLPTRDNRELLILPDSTQLTVECLWKTGILRFAGTLFGTFGDGSPAIVGAPHDRGEAIFCPLPVERSLSRTTYSLENGAAARLYRLLAERAKMEHPVDIQSTEAERTWHPIDADSGYLVVINHAEKPLESRLLTTRQPEELTIAAGSGDASIDDREALHLGARHAAVLHIRFNREQLQ